MSEAKPGDQEPPRQASWWRSVQLVAWSLLGVRSRKGYQEDLAKVSPLHVILIGLVAVLLLVIGLVVLVNWVVAKPV